MKIPTHCPLCNTITPRLLTRVHEEGGVRYTLYQCDSCALQFWWPLKNPGAEWYDHDVRYAGSNIEPAWIPIWTHKKTLSYFAGIRGKILDVGCGNGNFLVSASKLGWQCFGIDFSGDAVEAGKKWFGLKNLEVADVVDYAHAHSGEKFDVVTFFEVLEHLDNHNEFMESVGSLVRPGGYIAMSMPYREHAEWLMPLDVPPRHLTRWDPVSLKNFLEARGFSVVYTRRLTDGLWPIILKLRFRFGTRISFGAVNRVRRSLGDEVGVAKERPLLVRLTQILAKVKDACVFGIPALLIWLALVPSKRRYRTLYAIAHKNT